MQRVYVQRAVYDELVSRFVPKVEALVVGDPADEATDVGPLIDRDARERVLAWIDEARAAGAEILTGGELDGELLAADGDRERRRRTLKVSCEEVFGPVVHRDRVRHARRGDRARERRRATACRPASSRAI